MIEEGIVWVLDAEQFQCPSQLSKGLLGRQATLDRLPLALETGESAAQFIHLSLEALPVQILSSYRGRQAHDFGPKFGECLSCASAPNQWLGAWCGRHRGSL